jgi:hypothetical protein
VCAALGASGGPRAGRSFSGARWREAGSVTVELAVGLVSVVALLGLVLGLLAAGVAQIRCTDAARAGARAAALGQDDDAVRLVAGRAAGPRSEVSVSRQDDWVDVTVRVPVLAGRLLDDVVAQATAGVPAEP